MAIIKTTQITASMPDARNNITGRYIKYYTFKTFIDNKGNKTYYLNGKETTKDAGNDLFKQIMKYGKNIERTDSKLKVTYSQLIDNLLRGYDQNVEYIDDYKQYQSACKFNRDILDKVKKLRALIEAEA